MVSYSRTRRFCASAMPYSPRVLERRLTRREELLSVPRMAPCRPRGTSAAGNLPPSLQRRRPPVELVHRLDGAQLADRAGRLDRPGDAILDVLLLALREAAEDVVGRIHARGRAADPHPHPHEARAAHVLPDALHAVVPAVPAPHLHLHAERIEL